MLRRWVEGIALSLSWLTVLPVRGPQDIDRAAAGRAIAAAPVAGAVLGAVSAAASWLAVTAGAPPMAIGLLCVGVLALGTRGMHVDGLSDTADGLGCYGPPERAREVMHSGGAGPFGVVALIVVLGMQAVAFGSLAQAGGWVMIVLAVIVGRVAVVLACRRGVPAAPGSGFGTLVADTQTPFPILMWMLVACAASVVVAPGMPWLGPLVVLATLLLSAVFVRHCARRFGGLNGDVLGAVLEGTVATVALVAASAL